MWIDGAEVCQPALLALDPRDLLAPDHLVWRVMAQVERFDLSRFVAAHRGDGVGRPAYAPKKVLGLLIYCASKKMTSGLEIEQACRDDLGARMIMGGRVIDRSTVDRFRERHHAAIRGLLAQTLVMGEGVGLVDLSLVAGDGTKMRANAAMGATVQEGALRAQIEDLQQRLGALTAAWGEQAAAGAGDLDVSEAGFDLFEEPTARTGRGFGVRGADVPVGERVSWRRMQTLARVLASRQAALQHLLQRPGTAVNDWAEKVERDGLRVLSCREHLERTRARVQAAAERRAEKIAAGARIAGKRPVPVAEHTHVRQAEKALATATARAQKSAASRPVTGKVNTTDPGSRIMPGKHDGFDQRYNVQALACRNQFILAIGIHDSSNDKQALIALLQAARANLDAAGITRDIAVALFDAGYASEDNFDADLPVQKLLVAVEREARQTQRLNDATSHAAASWAQMSATMAEPANTALYKRRAAIIEPVFAQIFAQFGRELPRRGDGVETDLHLRAVVHNLKKIHKAGRRQRPG